MGKSKKGHFALEMCEVLHERTVAPAIPADAQASPDIGHDRPAGQGNGVPAEPISSVTRRALPLRFGRAPLVTIGPPDGGVSAQSTGDRSAENESIFPSVHEPRINSTSVDASLQNRGLPGSREWDHNSSPAPRLTGHRAPSPWVGGWDHNSLTAPRTAGHQAPPPSGTTQVSASHQASPPADVTQTSPPSGGHQALPPSGITQAFDGHQASPPADATQTSAGQQASSSAGTTSASPPGGATQADATQADTTQADAGHRASPPSGFTQVSDCYDASPPAGATQASAGHHVSPPAGITQASDAAAPTQTGSLPRRDRSSSDPSRGPGGRPFRPSAGPAPPRRTPHPPQALPSEETADAGRFFGYAELFEQLGRPGGFRFEVPVDPQAREAGLRIVRPVAHDGSLGNPVTMDPAEPMGRLLSRLEGDGWRITHRAADAESGQGAGFHAVMPDDAGYRARLSFFLVVYGLLRTLPQCPDCWDVCRC